MYLWLKINDSIAGVWFAKGNTPADVDNHIDKSEADSILGKDSINRLTELNNANYLKEETVAYMKMCGWVEKGDFFRSNGDVHAYCFQREQIK